MPPPPFPQPPFTHVAGVARRRLIALVAWALLIAASCVAVAHVQAQTRRGVDQRFALRASIASRFVTTYLTDLVARQTSQAKRHLSSRVVPDDEFERTVRDAGFGAAVLLDSRGRVLRVAPSKPALLGENLTARYDHLRTALRGRAAVSQVVPSAARGLPVVGVAVPFATRYGRRVYSGAYNVSRTPVGAYLRNAIATPQSRVFLLDPKDVVIASSGTTQPNVTFLRDVDPVLARALGHATQGAYIRHGASQRFATERVAGTPWRVLIVVPAARLYVTIGGATRWVPWLALGAFAVMSLIAVLLFVRHAADRLRLAALNEELERLVGLDVLTGLSNRRQISDDLTRAVSAARRHNAELSILLIDVDHFKRINDTFGHQIGDRALAAIADAMTTALRKEDRIGRWGGEEFLVILPATDVDGAIVVGERIRSAVAQHERLTDDGRPIQLRVSIGLAAHSEEGTDELVERADSALYAAKAAGRDRLEVALPPAALLGSAHSGV
jgi:diguanylate cyclase (GGDEF)-like protein